jgi:SAM-dependent methyltransferase
MLPDGWLSTRTGRNLLGEEVRQVRRALDSIFGDQLVQIGVWGDPALFSRLARTRRAAVVAEHIGTGADLISALDCLAITSDCVDAVFLPHTLERTADPHALLREVDRILRPDGHVVVLGFNPFGWWGLRHALSRETFPPGAHRLISDGRLCDWLRLLDFKVHHEAFYHFVPPIIRRAPLRLRLDAQDGSVDAASSPVPVVAPVTRRRPRPSLLGAQVRARLSPVLTWSGFASCYILVARKEQFVVTPIRLAWKRRARLVGSLVNPTIRNAA